MLPTIVAQVGDHISNQGINESQNDNATDDNIHEDVRNFNKSNGQSACSYKEFVACKPKDFDGKGGAIAYTRWVEKMEALQDISGYGDNQMVKYATVAATKPPTIQNVILKARVFIDEVVRSGSLRKTGEKRGDDGEPSKEGNFKGDNKRTRTRKVFATITNLLRRSTQVWNPNLQTALLTISPRCLVLVGRVMSLVVLDHYNSACPMLNRAPGQGGNLPNQALAIKGGQGRGNNGLSPSREIKFRINLIPGAIPVMKSPYRLAPTKMEELSNELKELRIRIKDRLKAARDRQKSYADKQRKALEFSVGDHLLLNLSPWKGVVCFKKKGKLVPRFVGPFDIIERIGPVAYRLRLPQELSSVHDTFHVSNLKKFLADPTLHVPLEEIQVDAKLNFVEEPVEILGREINNLKRSRISIVKIEYPANGHYTRDCQKSIFCDAKYFREQILLAMKDEAESNLKDEENDFMQDNYYGDEALEELTAAVIMMARIQPTDNNADSEPSNDAKVVSEINASNKLAKKAFKERENRYLDDIVDLEEKISSHDRIVYKMGQSIQTIHMLRKQPNKFYDPFLKARLGYKNPERLKKSIAAQLKMYHCEMFHSTNLKIDSPDSEEALKEVEESVESSNSVRRPKSKDTKSRDRVLKNTNDKRPSTHVQKMSSSVCVDSNKYETMNSIVCQPNASVLNTKTVNAVNDSSNIVCKDVFFLSHEKCVARYALSRDSKVIQLVLWIVDSGCSKHMTGNLSLLRNVVEKVIGTVRFMNDHFAAIIGYGDYSQGNLMICYVYYVEGLGHNLFLVG
uniref:Reverse transcriptase domain-containing protein n=1 Tax=Tanacetum cinerariifolium TaxID=118510 RepID=A0A6L2LX01_TANCI|nr:reverse transcriptase domain-containing protein [Tanacetum cinerariifolium]